MKIRNKKLGLFSLCIYLLLSMTYTLSAQNQDSSVKRGDAGTHRLYYRYKSS